MICKRCKAEAQFATIDQLCDLCRETEFRREGRIEVLKTLAEMYSNHASESNKEIWHKDQTEGGRKYLRTLSKILTTMHNQCVEMIKKEEEQLNQKGESNG